MNKVAELHEFLNAGSDAERAAVLLYARPVILQKFANQFIAASLRVDFDDGASFMTAFQEVLRSPMHHGCIFSTAYEEARMVLSELAR